MILYVIIECYQDYKRADATPWGIYDTLSDAKKALREAIKERFDYCFDEMSALEQEKWIDKRFKGETYWFDDDGDTITKFYIDKVNYEKSI